MILAHTTLGFTGGRQTFTVPPSVTSVTVRSGAVGGAATARAGGIGAYIQGRSLF